MDLTEQERRALLFISVVVASGLFISFLSRKLSGKESVSEFNKDVCKIDINRASPQELTRIKGIGERLARRIVEYRQEKGGISDIGQLRQIKGLQGERFKKLEDSVFLR